MNKKIVKIISEKRVYDGYFKVDEALIEDVQTNGRIAKYHRQKLTRPDAVTGLIYNVDTESIILVKQYRYPIADRKGNGFVIEAVAGKIDKGETPIETFKREVLEEVGYKIKNKNIQKCESVYASPGYSTEKIYLFLATVKNSDKTPNKGGGLKDENEDIEIVEIPYLQFKSMIDYMEDSKTRLLAYEAHYRKVFDIEKPKKNKKIKMDLSNNTKLDF